MNIMQPFQTQLDLQSGIIQPTNNIIQRKLSQMRGMYQANDLAESMLGQSNDPTIYDVYVVELPEENGQVLHCTTVLHAGKIGEEYYMTKGHYHSKRDQGEVYLGLSGEGYLLLQTEDGKFDAQKMSKGTVAYVPPYWAHRTVNVGSEPFVFFAAWPGDAGHDYGSIETSGFYKLLVERDGQPILIDNPNYAS